MRRSLLFSTALLSGLAFAGASHAQAITKTLAQDLGNNVDSNTANISASVTVPAGSTLLVLGVDGGATDILAGLAAPTYNGVNMAFACKTGRTNATAQEWTYIWYMLSPPTGAADTLFITAPAQTIKAGVVAYGGPTGLESCSTKNTATGQTSSTTVSTQAANDLVVDMTTGWTGQSVQSPFTLETKDAEYVAWSLSDDIVSSPASVTATNTITQNDVPNQAVAVFSSGVPKITAVSLSKLTFAANTANAVVGNLSSTFSSGSPSVAYSISGTNSCGFHIVSSTQVQAGASGCNPATYSDFTITATCSTCSPTTFAYNPTLEDQKITDISPHFTSASSFPAGAGNASLGTVVALINPASPAPAGAFSITGANSCGFHMVGSQVEAQSTGCSAVGGPHSNGLYDDWNVVFTPSNTDIAAFTQAEAATALPPGQFMLGNGTTPSGTLAPVPSGCAQWDANGNPLAAVCPSQGPQGPQGMVGPQGPAGQNAGQNTYPACPAPTATATVGQSMFCSNGSHTDIAVAPAANTWVFFGPAASTAP